MTASGTSANSPFPAPNEGEVIILIETEAGRTAFLATAAAALPRDECIVEVRDVIGRKRAFTSRPVDHRARLVARGEPTLLRGALTCLPSYWRVPLHSLRGREAHYEDGAHTHSYDVTLNVICRGRGLDQSKILV